MLKKHANRIVSLLPVGLCSLLAGCELLQTTEESSGSGSDTQAAATTSAQNQASPLDTLDLSTVTWLGANFADLPQTKVMNSATISESTIRLYYESLSGWPMNGEAQAMGCIFYPEGGRIVGGKFEWIAKGQTLKSTGPLHDGYNGHHMPSRGTDVWFMLVSTDGKQRTNTVKATWD